MRRPRVAQRSQASILLLALALALASGCAGIIGLDRYSHCAGCELEAGPEAMSASETAPPVRFCDTQPASAFCDDFDQDAGFDAASKWTEPTTEHGGLLERTPAEFRSPPNAFVARTTDPTNGQGWAYLRKELRKIPNRVTTSF